MKISAQEKIAELERRIVALEAALGDPRWELIAREARATRISMTTRTEPLTSAQHGHLDRMWTHFHKTFKELGKVFR